MWLFFLGCFGNPKDSGQPAVAPCVDCTLQNHNNYKYSSALDIRQYPLQPQSNALIEWSDLQIDVQGHSVEAEMIEQLTLVAFLHLTPEEIEEKLADDTLLQADISLYVVCTPENQRCELGDFGILGASLYVPEHFTDGQGVWMLALRSASTRGAHSFAFLIPDQSSSATEVNIDSTTADLQVDVHFTEHTPLLVQRDNPDVHIDWRELTIDGLGNETDPSKMDELFVAQYNGDLEDLERRFFTLDREYQQFWEMNLDSSGTTSLLGLQGETEFAGFSDEGTWLLALLCSTCLNPAPRFITSVVVQ